MPAEHEFSEHTAPTQPNTRIPHIGHAALFLGLVLLALIVTELAFVAFTPGPFTHTLTDPRLQLLAECAAYLVALLAAWIVFPFVWHRSFPAGLQWNGRAARPWLVLAGLALGFVSQYAETRLPIPKSLPMDALLEDRRLIPILAVLAVVVAPLMEEVLFRGFVLPALANAYDFLRLPKFELPAQALETHARWVGGPQSVPALILASFVTSVLFALIHAPQLGYTWPAVSLLAAVSLVLCLVRIRLRSVAASTLVHTTYNLSIFLTLAWITDGFQHMDKLH